MHLNPKTAPMCHLEEEKQSGREEFSKNILKMQKKVETEYLYGCMKLGMEERTLKGSKKLSALDGSFKKHHSSQG